MEILKISFDYNNASNAGNYWDVNNWEDGTTEPGSSGSPLFDGNTHRIVGHLYGGTHHVHQLLTILTVKLAPHGI